MRYGELEKCPKCGIGKLVGYDCPWCPELDAYLRRG